MRIEILGSLRVLSGGRDGGDGAVVAVGGARLRALLARLAMAAGRPVTIDALAASVWPGDGPADPGHALQSLVSRLRRALPDGSVLRAVPRGYRLDLPPEAVDAVRFARLAADGGRLLRAGEPAAARDVLVEALALWRGPALADAPDAPELVSAAARLAELHLTAREDRVEADLRLGTGNPVAELAELTAAHPLRERPRALLMRALLAEDRRAEALAGYERFRKLLADELGTDPGAELRALHRAALRGGKPSAPRRDAPPAAPRRDATGAAPSGAAPSGAAPSGAAPSGAEPGRHRRPGNLPAPLTSFVGRERERALVRERLAGARLVTLVGPGGVGKTRLATEVADDLREPRPGGVWLVELAGLRDPAEVPAAVSGVLGIREPGGPDPAGTGHDATTRLVAALASAETLLVLDNCEHLLDGLAPFVDALLGRCPTLRVLATSREPLGITGETLCPVPPLAVPEVGAAAVPSAAVRLFADRAAAVRPGFTVTAENGAAVAGVCRRLDGLPLAIELAAARLRTLTLAQLAARLHDRFQVLAAGSRTAARRHRTLRAVIAWSWDLLAPHEQRSAARLAVFPSSFDDAAARHVGVPGDTLEALVDKSLLQVSDEPSTAGPEHDGQWTDEADAAPPAVRYQMLETIREYGREQLVESGEHAATRAAHAGHYLALAERAAPYLTGPGQLSWIARLSAEHDNLTAALDTARDRGDAATAVRLGAVLGRYWTLTSTHADTAGRLRNLLDLPGEAPPAARRSLVASYLFHTVLAGESAEARARADQIASLMDADDPLGVLLIALYDLVADRAAAGAATVARWLRSSRSARADPWIRAMLRLVQAFAEASRGDWQAMDDDLSAAVEDFRAAGDRWGLSTSLTYRAVAQMTLGALDDAITTLESSLSPARELGTDEAPRLWLAIVRMNAGYPDRARAELAALVADARYVSTRQSARIALADLARHGNDLAEAARQLDLVDREPGAVPFRDAVYQLARGRLATATGARGEAGAHLRRALALAEDMPDMPLVASVAVGVAALALRHGDPAGAAELLGAAHGLRGTADTADPDVIRLRAELTSLLGARSYRDRYRHGQARSRDDALALIRQVRRR